jgi:hypothetical protein
MEEQIAEEGNGLESELAQNIITDITTADIQMKKTEGFLRVEETW